MAGGGWEVAGDGEGFDTESSSRSVPEVWSGIQESCVNEPLQSNSNI